MKRLLLFATLIPLAFSFEQLEEKENTAKTLPAARELDIDNVNGSIHVTGYSGSDIRLEAHRVIRADDAQKMEEAKRDVKLDIKQTGDTLKVYVDGPFRCNCNDSRERTRSRGSSHEHGRRGYNVVYDFDLKVPASTGLLLSTINNGEIKVENVAGDFDVDNINGGVEMHDVSGSGRAHALNGKVIVTFARNPVKESYFGSLNGAIEVSFQPGLSADLSLKTFNGHAYTDFAVTGLATAAAAPERRNGKFVYRSHDFTTVRAGNGGPQYKFDAFNGDIRILNRGQK
jgi:DUF4097 and DUF4098 domain-containing protein YvlB